MDRDTPVVLVHGWGGSFADTWQRSGFAALLEDMGRRVIGVDLLGHGTAPKPHDPAAYGDLTTRVEEAIDAEGGGAVDAVGFSLGALTLVNLAVRRPSLFRRVVLAGVGRNVFERDDAALAAILAALDDDTPADERDNISRLFRQYADQPGNDRQALAAVFRNDRAPLDPAALNAITCPVLVAIGERDFAGPGDSLAAALPDATLTVLPRTDHFATPESFAFFDAALAFLATA